MANKKKFNVYQCVQTFYSGNGTDDKKAFENLCWHYIRNY